MYILVVLFYADIRINFVISCSADFIFLIITISKEDLANRLLAGLGCTAGVMMWWNFRSVQGRKGSARMWFLALLQRMNWPIPYKEAFHYLCECLRLGVHRYKGESALFVPRQQYGRGQRQNCSLDILRISAPLMHLGNVWIVLSPIIFINYCKYIKIEWYMQYLDLW